MTTPVIHATPRPQGAHSVARPLPPPPRARQASPDSRRPLDRLGRALEQWISELPLGSTEAGD